MRQLVRVVRLSRLLAGLDGMEHRYLLMMGRAGLWVGPLPRALTSRGRQKGGHRLATH
jgi:hypothetical protein